MPLSTQALYFHLCMRADDEGFINNYKKIQRMVGASDDDLKLLYLKKFILHFESGVIVVKHWKMHNYIQKDRFKPTVFSEERALLRLKDNNSYTFLIDDPGTKCIQDVSKADTKCIQDVSKADTECIQDGYSLDTLKNDSYSKNDTQTRMNTDGYKVDTECIQNGYSLDTQVRLGKVSIELGKDRIELGKVRLGKYDQTQPDTNKLSELFEEIQKTWNALELYGFKPVRIIGPGTVRGENLYQCLQTFGAESFLEVIEKIKSSDFLKGKNKDKWQPDFDWVITPENYTKILEGNYEEIYKPISKVRNFCPEEPERTSEDFEELEQQLLDN